MMNVGKYILILLCVLMTMPLVFGDEIKDDDDAEDRRREFDHALVGDTAALLEAGELQITIGASFEDEDDKDSNEIFVEFEYGITDWLEIGLQTPYLLIDPKTSGDDNADGIGDVSLLLSTKVFAKEPFFVSVSLDVSFPTGDENRNEDLGEGVVVWELAVISDIELGNAEIVVGIGAELLEKGPAFLFDATVAYQFDDIVPSIGIDGSINEDANDVSLTPGIGFPIVEDVELGIEVPIGLTSNSANWGIVAEVTLEF